MISERMPRRKSTAVRRRCSSSMVPTSLKRGTTTDSRIPDREVLRDMTKAPARPAREIVSEQLNALAEEKRPRFHAAQKGDLFQARLDQTRGPAPQRLVDVAGMHHQFGDARPCVVQHVVEHGRGQNAGRDATDEMGRPDAEPCRDAI